MCGSVKASRRTNKASNSNINQMTPSQRTRYALVANAAAERRARSRRKAKTMNEAQDPQNGWRCIYSYLLRLFS
ncbi:hypothetical protein PCIT_a0270 [Pseudoalteromonas citrea]|uniref:Uncharacterized protein n=2 Tax=Pseudoalteromonas citrea TaxID=43655 RepID=A0AAD4AKP2_9GAMM|nr:hypothetical protein PCIT_a0270 [Pseudoalteromonas citrea]